MLTQESQLRFSHISWSFVWVTTEVPHMKLINYPTSVSRFGALSVLGGRKFILYVKFLPAFIVDNKLDGHKTDRHFSNCFLVYDTFSWTSPCCLRILLKSRSPSIKKKHINKKHNSIHMWIQYCIVITKYWV